MRCMVFVSSLIFVLFCYGCSRTEKKVYIYNVFTENGKSLNSFDTLILEKDIKLDSTFYVTIFSGGKKKKIVVVHKQDSVKVKDNNINEVIYAKKTTKTFNNFTNGLIDDISTFYNVNFTSYSNTRIYRVNNKDYNVDIYMIKNNMSSCEYVYYVPEIGFILQYDSESALYKKIVEIQSSDNKNEIAINLCNAILSDSTYWNYKRPIIKPPY